ncbi:MAG: polysaccharide deacetylase family protein [Magnetococcus sp. DMHC-6]
MEKKCVSAAPIHHPSNTPPILMVVVDTEEEFDWNKPFAREAIAVTAMQEIERGQEICDSFGIKPVYVVDYPIVHQEMGFMPLLKLVTGDRAVIGTHLHPWVSPPFHEELSSQNAFPGNLDADLELAKLAHLTGKIQQVFGQRPLIYKAGRYGRGPHTEDILEYLGYCIDLSPMPPFDFRSVGGPDFSFFTPHPFWFGRGGEKNRLLCLPTSGGFVGFLRWQGQKIYSMASAPWMQRMRGLGILSRLGALERVRLSPEGHTLEEMQRLTYALLQDGVGVFTLSYHSPSLKPGCTPYVQDAIDLKYFLHRLEGYLDFFCNHLGGQVMTPFEIKAFLEGPRVISTALF